METEADDRAAKNSDGVSLVTLDFFDGNDKSAPNRFELSDVRLVRERRNTNEEESHPLDDIIAEEPFAESAIVEKNIFDDLLNSRIADDEDDYSGGMQTDENIEEFLKEGHRSLTPSDKGNSDVLAILEEEKDNEDEEDKKEYEIEAEDKKEYEIEAEDKKEYEIEAGDKKEYEMEDVKEEYEATTEASLRRFDRTSRKFTFASDIEEVDEEMEEYEKSVSEVFRQPDSEEEIHRVRDAELYITETRLTLARSRMINRAASVLEQRLKMISGLKQLFEERKKLALKNRFLNKKCCEFIKKITTVDLFENVEGALSIHGNQRYHAVLEEYIATKTDYEKAKPSLESEIENLTDSYHTCRAKFDQVFEDFRLRELEIGFQCVNRNTGKSLGEQRVRSLVKKQQGRFNDLANVRVHYLKLNNRLADINAKVRELNRMGEGHTLMDYEQLMIENSSHVDKLDEREKTLLKLGDKCAQCISILSHMKETSDVFVCDIMTAATKLAEVVDKKSEARTSLAIERKRRESLRKTIARIRHSVGLLGSPAMLRRMEVDSEALNSLTQKVRKLMDDNPTSVDPDNVAAIPEK